MPNEKPSELEDEQPVEAGALQTGMSGPVPIANSGKGATDKGLLKGVLSCIGCLAPKGCWQGADLLEQGIGELQKVCWTKAVPMLEIIITQNYLFLSILFSLKLKRVSYLQF